MSEFNQEAIFQLQKFAKSGKSIHTMLEFMIEYLELNENSRVILIAYFQKAFSLNMKEAMQIGAWNYFPGGTWDISEVESALRPVIEKSVE